MKPQQLYLDLLKKTLSFALWPEPPVPVEAFNERRSLLRRTLVSWVSRILRFAGLQIVRPGICTKDEQEEGRIWPAYADTMVGMKRLDNLQQCVETVLRDGVEGDLIETGVWRGGSCILMRGILAAYGVLDRRVFVADSFEGLPRPEPEGWSADRGDTRFIHTFLAVSQEQVENNFKRYGLLDDKVVFLKGWFKDTLPEAPIGKLSILRLDGDMYGSTMDALQNLYPKLSTGGYCIIDDYALKGCRMAVDDYRLNHKITSPMIEIDWTGRYSRKE